MAKGRKGSTRKTGRAAGRRRSWLLPVIIALVTVGIATGFALTQRGSGDQTSSAAWSSESHQGGARLAVDRTEVDDGAVRYGQQVKATFRLKNVGDQLLTLRKPTVETLEGC